MQGCLAFDLCLGQGLISLISHFVVGFFAVQKETAAAIGSLDPRVSHTQVRDCVLLIHNPMLPTHTTIEVAGSHVPGARDACAFL